MQDFIEMGVSKGDLIKFTEDGCSIVQDLETLKDDLHGDYEVLKDRFLRYYELFHEEKFYDWKTPAKNRG